MNYFACFVEKKYIKKTCSVINSIFLSSFALKFNRTKTENFTWYFFRNKSVVVIKKSILKFHLFLK